MQSIMFKVTNFSPKPKGHSSQASSRQTVPIDSGSARLHRAGVCLYSPHLIQTSSEKWNLYIHPRGTAFFFCAHSLKLGGQTFDG